MLQNFVAPNLLPAAPEIFLLIAASLILMVDLVVKDPRKSFVYSATQLSFVGALLITVTTFSPTESYTFSNMFVDDAMADLLKACAYIVVVFVLAYSRQYMLARREMLKGEYYVLAIFATIGMMVMISANHFITIYLGLELLSLSLYAMVAINRDSTVSIEAAMKYFVLGALASGLLLYGMSMLYGATGTLEITAVGERLYGVAGAGSNIVLIFGLVFIVAGLAFKLGAVPFHMWVPDVYQGAPTSVTLFIASAPKLAAFAIVARLLVSGLIMLSPDWQIMLALLAVLSMAIGNLAAIAQTNIKRMLAYSAISHMGFLLLAMATGVVNGDGRYMPGAYSSALFYVISYVLMSAGSFGVVLLMSRAGFEAEELSDYKGLNKRSPWFAAVMAMMMFSMAGIPFFVGFFAKFAVLQSVVIAGYMELAIIAVLFSLIGAFYYLRVVKIMYFDVPQDESPIQASFDLKALLSINGLSVALLGAFPNLLMTICLAVTVQFLH
jgi:NADH-quinone oxidoreductase subunit N